MKNIIKILLVAIFSLAIVSCSRASEDIAPTPIQPVVPTLSKAGIYPLSGNSSLFNVSLRMKKGSVNYLFENQENPYQGKMLSIGIEGVPALNETRTIVVGVQNLDIPSGKIEVKVEKISEQYLQLASDKYRFVIPKK